MSRIYHVVVVDTDTRFVHIEQHRATHAMEAAMMAERAHAGVHNVSIRCATPSRAVAGIERAKATTYVYRDY